MLTGDRDRRAAVLGRPRTRWTAPQQRVFDSPYTVTVAWGANGTGKSLMLAEIVRRGLARELPWQRAEPQTVILTGNSWSQIGVTLGYLWETVDKRWFKESLHFEAGAVRGQRLPVFDIIGGPGRGGQLRCGTFNAGAQNLAGPRAHLVVSDEPLEEALYNELVPRLFGRQGRIIMGFTPTLGTSADVEYLWKKVDDPAMPWVGEIQIPLTLDAVTLRGGLVPYSWTTQEEIDRMEQNLSAMERDMRMGRSRTPRLDTAYFSSWGPQLIRNERPPEGARVGVGIDHGSRPGAQRAVLVALDARRLAWGPDHESRAWVLDEYQGDGRTESEDDARGILAMLERQGLRVEHVDVWIGDRAHGGYQGGNGAKSNERLKASIAKALGHDTRGTGWTERLPAALRYMQQPRKYDRSVWEGCEMLHRMMVGAEPRLQVSSRCTALHDDLRQWQGRTRDPHKDGIDALRYVVVGMIEGRERR